MADNRTSQLLAASFKGVPFRIRNEAVDEAGRKLVQHRYVNSDTQFIEDQGQVPAQVTLEIFVHGPNYINQAATLEAALNEIGPGLLTTPAFGTFKAYAGAYRKRASQKTIGEISFSVPFFTGRPAAGPSTTEIGTEEVYQLGDEARDALGDTFAEVYPTIEDATNALVAAGDLTTLTQDIENAISAVLPSTYLQDMTNIIDVVQLNASKLIRDSSDLAFALFSGTPEDPGLWQIISLGLSETVTPIIDQASLITSTDQLITSALNVGLDQLILLAEAQGGGLSLQINDINRSVAIDPESTEIPLWPATTSQRIARNSARTNIVYAMRIAALVGAYEVAAAKTYSTDADVTKTRADIEDIYKQTMLVESDDYDLIQSKPAVRSAVDKVRLAALDVIEQKQQTAFKVIDETVKAPTSSFAHAYLLYAEQFTDDIALGVRTMQLAELNSSQPSVALSGTFKIFQVT